MTNPLTDSAARAAAFASETAEAARVAANDAYGAARTKLHDAYAGARDTASAASQRTAETVSEAPLAVIAGGLALGALAGALLPSTRRETELLGPVGEKINDAAKIAASAARAAGIAKLDELGINRDNAKAQVDRLVSAVTEGATTAGSAAADTIRKK